MHLIIILITLEQMSPLQEENLFLLYITHVQYKYCSKYQAKK